MLKVLPFQSNTNVCVVGKGFVVVVLDLTFKTKHQMKQIILYSLRRSHFTPSLEGRLISPKMMEFSLQSANNVTRSICPEFPVSPTHFGPASPKARFLAVSTLPPSLPSPPSPPFLSSSLQSSFHPP